MPRQSGDGWFLKYESAKASTRLLLSLPKPMLDDAHAVAKVQGISVAELARRAMTHHMSELVKANPSLVALRGARRDVVERKHAATEPCSSGKLVGSE